MMSTERLTSPRRLPLLDIGPFLADPDGEAGQAFVASFTDACHAPGFCYLTGHGVADELNARLLAHAARFFALPEAERRAIAIGRSPHFRGYTILGDEHTNGKRDWRDQIDFGPDEPDFVPAPDDPPWMLLRGPNQWPQSVPELRTTALQWTQDMQLLAFAVLDALGRGLEQPPGHLQRWSRPQPYTRVKIIRYPALPAAGASDQGLGMHHDSGLLSFILQDGVGGLQVDTPEGLIEATPVPGAFVMNLGEMLQAATGGYLRATPHGVASPPPGTQRISIAYFFNPRLDARIEPLELPAALARRAVGGQNADPDDPVFSTFGNNTLKIRMRAHPDVRKRFYAGVELAD